MKYFFRDFRYMKSLFSPFKPFKIKFYIGKIRIGTPYFFPRRWVNDPKKPGHTKAIPKKIGFDFVSLGWKTKWNDTDYRYEWSPLISFVIFGLQMAIIIKTEHPDHYWTSWLYYEFDTDKSLSKEERIKKCIKEFPQNWITTSNGETKNINYYELILRKRYLKWVSKENERDSKLNELGI